MGNKEKERTGRGCRRRNGADGKRREGLGYLIEGLVGESRVEESGCRT